MFNLCLFGAGRIGTIHANCAAQNPDVQIKYVVDVFPQAADKVAKQLGATVVDVESALADPEIHAVIIASSTDTHADLIERSALAGKHIFCEKPVDLTVERVETCIRTVKENNVHCAIGFNRRFDPMFAELQQAVRNGQIGSTEIIQITSRDPSPPPAEYIKVSGGLFKDMMIHDFDMARWLLDEEPVEVFANGSCLVDATIGEAGDIDTALVTLKTASGKLCQISNSRRAVYGYDQRIEAFGSDGMLQVNNKLENGLVATGSQGTTTAKPQHFFLERYADAYRLELNNFIEVLRGNAKPLADEKDGLNALLLAEAALESFKTKKAVAVNLKG
ncbi:inositol 2-dehydrogenase [Parashewanella spongiae]|uniref:Inositol 2-dehydrogenase n=1 Tax=Parashewanella spongiae TaxID=342950 RepID=A0A3A6TG31_9GAMM|nr:inositol 2-dehydrogenase [Parashewanella spongiae]MCL1079114.1 inositol 2-dehydrogenase [Parashewanella spongiae]RJY10727.1 inositol 2-dehydrogenase [Parashewanella spongiae]